MDQGCIVPGCANRFYALGYCSTHYGQHRKYPDETPEQLAVRNRKPRTPEEMRLVLVTRVVATSDGCWEWQGAKDRRGYGNIRWDGHLWGAHRLAYHLFTAPVERGQEVCHHCDNPPCCNPRHLFVGTHADNMADAALKGLSRGGDLKGEQVGTAKLTEADVRAIRASNLTQVELAKAYGVGQPAISAIKLRKVWKHVA